MRTLDTGGNDHGGELGEHWDALGSPPGCMPEVVNRLLDIGVQQENKPVGAPGISCIDIDVKTQQYPECCAGIIQLTSLQYHEES